MSRSERAHPVISINYKDAGHRFSPGTLDVLARLGLLRLPSVARLEFIPMKIGAGMTTFLDTVGLWTDTNYKLTQNIGEFYE